MKYMIIDNLTIFVNGYENMPIGECQTRDLLLVLNFDPNDLQPWLICPYSYVSLHGHSPPEKEFYYASKSKKNHGALYISGHLDEFANGAADARENLVRLR